MSIRVNNFFRDRENISKRLNDAFVQIVGAKALDTAPNPVVSSVKDPFRHSEPRSKER